MKKKLAGYAQQVPVCTLGKEEKRLSEIMREIEETEERVCLFIGSPVYSSHALPLMMGFIARLPQRREAYAAPFATWGGVTSGLTLDPYPVYADHCILCFNCMRWCPEQAIEADLAPIHERVRERAEKYQEDPPSAIFLPGEIHP